jgi:hypothetical protein
MDSSALLNANDVSYNEVPAVAATTRRTLGRIPALKDTYKDGDVLIINVETGSDFVDWCSSMLTFKTTTDATATMQSTDSTILDCFREVVVYSRNGTELLRQQFFNLYSRSDLIVRHSKDWLDTVGSSFGYGDNTTDHAAGVTWSVPMRVFSDLMCKNQKSPPQLVSGMRIEIVLESAQKSFIWADENSHSYNLTEIVLLADTHTLTDAISRKIMSDSAQNGLVQQWTDYSHISQDVGAASTRATVNFQKSVARASRALVLVRSSSNIDLHVNDSLATQAFDVSTSRFRIGSLYFPRQDLDRPTTHYLNTLRAYKKLQSDDDSLTSLSLSRHNARSIIATLLDRDDDLENSGVSTSRAQGDLLAEITFNTGIERRLDCFLLYEKQIQVGLSSVRVNE